MVWGRVRGGATGSMGGSCEGQLAPPVPSAAGMGLPAAVRDRVAAVHRGSALPERLRLYDGWAARYEQVPGTQRERERREAVGVPADRRVPRRMWRLWSTGHRIWPPPRSPSPSPRRVRGRGCWTWRVAPGS